VRGWRQAVSALGTSTDAILDESAGKSGGPRTEQFNEILSRCRKTRTTGLLVHSDTQAVALVQHCRDLGVAVPGELAVVAYDDEVAYLAEPAISAVRPPKHYVGRVAVQMLAARIAEGRRRPVHRLELNPDLIVRDSSLGTPHPTPLKVDLS
jgi:DNA-binding LacI/PurR family transcriptional regulator